MIEGLQNTGNPDLGKVSAVEDIADYDNQALRVMFADKGIVDEGEVISLADYEAIRTRAAVILNESAGPLSAEAALLAACVDRLQLVEKMGTEKLKGMSADALKAVFYAETGVMFDDEEINLFKDSPLPMGEWIERRSEIRQTLQ